jgi:hypothetical protein
MFSFIVTYVFILSFLLCLLLPPPPRHWSLFQPPTPQAWPLFLIISPLFSPPFPFLRYWFVFFLLLGIYTHIGPEIIFSLFPPFPSQGLYFSLPKHVGIHSSCFICLYLCPFFCFILFLSYYFFLIALDSVFSNNDILFFFSPFILLFFMSTVFARRELYRLQSLCNTRQWWRHSNTSLSKDNSMTHYNRMYRVWKSMPVQ